MSDLQIIQKIEKKIGTRLQRLSWHEFQELRPETRIKREVKQRKGEWIFCRELSELLFNREGLVELDFGANSLKDLSILTGLSSLQSLDIGSNHASDLSPLKELRSLKRLCLIENQVSD